VYGIYACFVIEDMGRVKKGKQGAGKGAEGRMIGCRLRDKDRGTGRLLILEGGMGLECNRMENRNEQDGEKANGR
jgi:hypothetical protein